MARVLVREGREPRGFVVVPVASGTVRPEDVRAAARRRNLPVEDAEADGATRHAARAAPSRGLQPLDDEIDAARGITVAICTRDRPAELSRCLESLRGLDYPRFEVLVIDNAPSGRETHDIVGHVAGHDARIRYVREDRPGLSNARNRALREARFETIAFTDDDVRIDRWWLRALARGFQRGPHIACVTGLVAVARLRTSSERFFETRVSWSDRLVPAEYDLSHPAPTALFPFQPGLFGTGANFAVERQFMRELGGFDPVLGAGSPTNGGEDLDAFVRIILASGTIAYEPAAIIWHFHRTSDAGLSTQMRDYGMGLSALVTKWLLAPGTRKQVLRRVIPGTLHAVRMWGATAFEGPVGARPAYHLLLAELQGVLAGPTRYWAGLRAERRAVVP
ncbi:MAG: glycosyltransferase [Actinomycetota bacterium]|nr:glycosyltransferase [Actinomycetota bacterium]